MRKCASPHCLGQSTQRNWLGVCPVCVGGDAPREPRIDSATLDPVLSDDELDELHDLRENE